MISVRSLSEFTAWLDALKDSNLRGIIAARIKRLQLGLLGDVSPVGEGVSELRIHTGAGWRVYFTQRGPLLIVLLVGGSKRTQAKTFNGLKRSPPCSPIPSPRRNHDRADQSS